MSEKAYSKLKQALGDFGEYLPVAIDDDIWYVFNILKKGDALIDVSSSEREVVDGVQMGINSITFKDDNSPMIFKTDFYKNVRIFCTDEFKRLVQGAGLTGLKFNTDRVN